MTRKILLATLFALAACEGSDNLLPPDDSGWLRFSHSGISQLPAAAYDADGEVALGSTGQFSLGDWAFAQLSASAADPMLILASQPSAGAAGHHDFAVMEVPRTVQAGATLPLALDCDAASCAELGTSFRLTPAGDNPAYSCNLTTGEIHVAARSSDRIAGTFSGTGTCFGPASSIEQTLQVTGGTFDVPIFGYPGDLR
jgi:hypothetical protein